MMRRRGWRVRGGSNGRRDAVRLGFVVASRRDGLRARPRAAKRGGRERLHEREEPSTERTGEGSVGRRRVEVAVLLAEGLRAEAGGERGVAQLREDAELLLVTNDATRVEDAARCPAWRRGASGGRAGEGSGDEERDGRRA